MQMRNLVKIHRWPKMVEDGMGWIDKQSLAEDQAHNII